MSATRAPRAGAGDAELLAAAQRAHAVEHDEVTLLDPLAVADDLLAALHRDAHRLDARRRLRAPAPGLRLVVHERRPHHGRREPPHRRPQRGGLPLEPHLGGPHDLVARRGEGADEREVGDDALALRRAVAHGAHDEAPVPVGGEEGLVLDDHPGEPLAREPGELPLHRLREARARRAPRDRPPGPPPAAATRTRRAARRSAGPARRRARRPARARAPPPRRASARTRRGSARRPRRRRRRRARRRGARPRPPPPGGGP